MLALNLVAYFPRATKLQHPDHVFHTPALDASKHAEKTVASQLT